MTEQDKKINVKEQEKMKELKLEFLKNNSKRKKIKREVARLLTLQNKKEKGENKN